MQTFDARQSLLLSQLDSSGIGLEIGASYSPVAPKSSGLNVRVADYIDETELRRKYQNAAGVDIGRIEPVDYVLGARTLGEAIAERSHFDYIIASHVIEHVPDLLGFLLDCQALLKPSGVLALAVPDKRSCFDFLLPLSTTGQVLEAHRNLDRRPRHGSVFDFEAYRCELDGRFSWSLGSGGNVTLGGTVAHALGMAELSAVEYVDVHIWRFVPASFRLLLIDLNTVASVRLREKAFLATSNIEFYCFLSCAGQGPAESRKQLALEAIREQCVGIDAVQ
jgi:SAM-dependent methyltransferase